MEWRNARFADSSNKSIHCEMRHPQLGWVEFMAMEADPEESGRVLFAAMSADPDTAAWAGPSAEQVRVAAARQCAEDIVGGVMCDALGDPHLYATGQTDQINLTGTVIAAMLDGQDGGPYHIWCADDAGHWARRPHTAAQCLAVGKTVRAHIVSCQEIYAAAIVAA